LFLLNAQGGRAVIVLATPACRTEISSVRTVLLGGGLENRLSWSTRNRQVIFRRAAVLLVVARLPREPVRQPAPDRRTHRAKYPNSIFSHPFRRVIPDGMTGHWCH